MGSMRDKAEGRDPREGPRFGMATGMPEEKEIILKYIEKNI